jgi:hypothetical protein
MYLNISRCIFKRNENLNERKEKKEKKEESRKLTEGRKYCLKKGEKNERFYIN